MMVALCELPASALLARYRETGAYTDCFRASVAPSVSLAQYVEAFYTTPVFKRERFVLRVAAARASTDAQARELGAGSRSAFAAWKVEDRTDDQLLLGDVSGRTKSWLMVASAGEAGTWLYFGSAVVPARNRRSGKLEMGLLFRGLLGFHKQYSRILLGAAASRLA